MKKIAIIACAASVIIIIIAAIIWYQRAIVNNVTIGALVPITGQLSVIGENMRNGMEMAKQDLVTEGVVKSLNIIYQDACNEATSWVAAKKLVQEDKVKIIASSFCIFGQDAIMSFTETNKVIIFNTAANSKQLLNKKYGFSTHTTVEHEGQQLANYAYYVLHAKTAAIIHLDSSFGRGYRDGFAKQFEAQGGKIILTQAKQPISEDFEAPLELLKKNPPDVLFIAHFGASLGYAVKQAREIGIKSIIVGEYESEDPTMIRLAKGAAEGMIISYPEQIPPTQKMVDFEKHYEAKYGEAPNLLAKNCYDAVILSVTAFVVCKGNTDCMAHQLEQIKNYDGVSGAITINKDHSVIKPINFKIIKSGKFIPITAPHE